MPNMGQNQAHMSTKGLITTTMGHGLGTGMGITGLSITGGTAGNQPSGIYSTITTNTLGSSTIGTMPTIDGRTQFTGKIQAETLVLTGEDADIIIDGQSLCDWLTHIEQRLGILTPNPALEEEWDELRDLAQRYRELEKICKEKTKMWQGLKKIRPPVI